MDEQNAVMLYQDPQGDGVEVRVLDESVWLSQLQIANLFSKDIRTINYHVNQIFKEEELEKETVIRNFRITATDGRSYDVQHYNLDVIISVGYRVKSKQGTQFRIWANKVLKQYLTQGYAIDRVRLQSQARKLTELENAIKLIQDASHHQKLASDEAAGLLDVITRYARTWVLLQRYDHDTLSVGDLVPIPAQPIDYDEVRGVIDVLRRELIRNGEAGDLFGVERKQAFLAVLGTVTQTYDAHELYPSIEEKAAHLLYFVIKDHPFVDGNKRIGSLLFVWFLQRNHYLINQFGERKINDNALVALALLVAESKPSQKETMVALIINLIGRGQ